MYVFGCFMGYDKNTNPIERSTRFDRAKSLSLYRITLVSIENSTLLSIEVGIGQKQEKLSLRLETEVLHKKCIIGKSCTRQYLFEHDFYNSRKVFCEKVITLSLLVVNRFIYNKLQSDDLKNRSSLVFMPFLRFFVKL